MSLSILCITKGEPHARAFLKDMHLLAYDLRGELVLGWDTEDDCGCDLRNRPLLRLVKVKSAGYLESVHDQVLAECEHPWVLRLDDDERCSPAMVEWLKARAYESKPLWKFPRATLWGSPTQFLMTPQLWPDSQTRLGKKTHMGGRTFIHCGSPFGGGEEAPVILEHHKMIVRDAKQRREIALTYDRVLPGAGTGGFLPFNLPEVAYADQEVPVATLGDGAVRPFVLTNVRLT
jgi:hypothetical protein